MLRGSAPKTISVCRPSQSGVQDFDQSRCRALGSLLLAIGLDLLVCVSQKPIDSGSACVLGNATLHVENESDVAVYCEDDGCRSSSLLADTSATLVCGPGNACFGSAIGCKGSDVGKCTLRCDGTCSAVSFCGCVFLKNKF